LSPVILRTLAAGLELAAEASGRGPREEPLYTLAGAMELFAGDMEPGADGPGRWRSSG